MLSAGIKRLNASLMLCSVLLIYHELDSKNYINLIGTVSMGLFHGCFSGVINLTGD